MKNPEIAKVFEEIDNGTITLEEANKRLFEAGAPYHLNPWKNHIGRNEQGVGLLDTGTGSLDKVQICNGRLVNCDCGEMYALVAIAGKTYRVKGQVLTE